MLFLAIIILPGSSYCQKTNQESGIKGNVIIGIGSTLNVHRYAPADNRIYKEISLDYGINSFMSIGLYAGHQRRVYSAALIQNPPKQIIIHPYSQTFFPVGIRSTIHFTRLITDHSGIKVDPDRFDIYVTYLAGVAFNDLEDNFDRRGKTYSYDRTDDEVNYMGGIVSGVRYYPIKNVGVFLEGGFGTMGNINLGLSILVN